MVGIYDPGPKDHLSPSPRAECKHGQLSRQCDYCEKDKEIDRLRAIEAAAKDWLKAHDAHLALYAKGDANFHELDATVAKRTEARERLRLALGEGG